MTEENRSLLEKIVRGVLILILGVFVFAGLVLGACFLVVSQSDFY
jgi:hypothetical protein